MISTKEKEATNEVHDTVVSNKTADETLSKPNLVKIHTKKETEQKNGCIRHLNKDLTKRFDISKDSEKAPLSLDLLHLFKSSS